MLSNICTRFQACGQVIVLLASWAEQAGPCFRPVQTCALPICQRFVIRMASMSANDSVSCVARDWKAHSNVLRYWFHWWARCLGGTVQLTCWTRKKSWPWALTRYSVVPHHRGLTTSHRPRLKPPGLRATSGSQAQSGWRPSWAEHRGHSETLARLTSPGSKQNDGLSEGLEPRTNVRE